MKPYPNAVADFKSAFHRGDTTGMAKAMDQAMQNDTAAMEAAVVRTRRMHEEWLAMPIPAKNCVISMAGTRGSRLYVKGIQYGNKDGGWEIKKVSFCLHASEAARFGETSVREVGKRLYASYREVRMEESR